MKKNSVLFIVILTIQCQFLYANGFNRINEFFVPLLIILFAICYVIPAFIIAIIVLLILKYGLKKTKTSLVKITLGSWLGGELGIAISVLVWKLLTSPTEWNSYLYTFYPWLILMLSICGAVISFYISTAKSQN